MTYGPLTIEQWRQHWREGTYLHVFLDGVDVTTNCFFADDVAGVIDAYQRDDLGHIVIDPDTRGPSRVRYTGRVEIVPEPIDPFKSSSGGEVN